MWLSAEELEEKGESLMKYLHGYCHEWIINNYQKGDKICVFIEYDEDIGKDCLLHCCLHRGNKYLDVRGETGSMDWLLDDFDWGSCEYLSCKDLEEFKNVLRNLGVV